MTDANRIVDDPQHPHHGAATRLGAIIDQLMADQGGLKAFETAHATYKTSINSWPVTWDASLDHLLRNGFSETAAIRNVTHCILNDQVMFAQR